jgi:hypothetical protein
LTQEKKDAWTWFSKFIRARDCLATTGTTTEGKCITCNEVFPVSRLQAGHFVSSRTDIVLFNENITNAQCYRCNIVLNGLWPVYYAKMLERFGQEKVNELIHLFFQQDDEEYTIEDYQQLAKIYKEKYERLLVQT